MRIKVPQATGEHEFLVVEREGIGALVLSCYDDKTVVVAVRLAIQIQKWSFLLHKFAEFLLHEAMAEIR